jgi:hypothetical protein
MKMPKPIVLLLTIFVCVAGLKVASATTAQSEAPVILCANKKTGAVRIITRGNCTAAETKYEINKTGPQGLRGATGPAGAPGTNGTNGRDGVDGQDGADGADGATGPAGADAPIPPSHNFSNDQLRRAAWFEASEPIVAANVGVEPRQAVFDGLNIWVVSVNNSMTRINTLTNVATTFTLPTISGMFATGVALMTDYIAVGYSSVSATDGKILKFDFDGNQSADTHDTYYGGTLLRLVSDTNYVWTLPSTDLYMYGLTDSGQQHVMDVAVSSLGKVVSVSAWATDVDIVVTEVPGSQITGLVSYVQSGPSPIVMDTGQLDSKPTDSAITKDDTLWVISESDNSYTKIGIGDSATLNQTWNSSGSVSAPTAIATDGTDVYVVSETDNSITRIKANGESATIDFDANVSYRPVDIVFDGRYFWVVNAGSSNLVKVAPF